MSNGGHTTYDLGHLPVGWDDLLASSRNSQSDEERGFLTVSCVCWGVGGGLDGSEACMCMKTFHRVGKGQDVLRDTRCVICV